MFNSLDLLGLGLVWLTQAEADSISADLLAGKTFVKIDRLQKTYNSSQVQSCGPTNIFLDPMVKGGDFAFTFNGIYAKIGDKEYQWNRGWKLSRGSFTLGMPFDQLIASLTV